MSFTKGPWRIGTEKDDMGTEPDFPIVSDAGGIKGLPWFVAAVWNSDWTPTNAANARLIAAAPDLYAALKEAEACLDYVGVRDEGIDFDRVDNARTSALAALANAEEP